MGRGRGAAGVAQYERFIGNIIPTFNLSGRRCELARLYLICGLPCSGKSTLVRQLAQRLGCGAVSFDAINHERELGFAREREMTEAEWGEMYGIARGRVAPAAGSWATSV